MRIRKIYITLFLSTFSLGLYAQDMAYQDAFASAYDLVNKRKYTEARKTLKEVLKENPKNSEALFLLARTYSWMGYYNQARKEFNKITSVDRKNSDVWISAVKNELYAKNDATALGLANKALLYLKNDSELERLRNQALKNVKNKKYPAYKEENETVSRIAAGSSKKSKAKEAPKKAKTATKEKTKPKKETNKDIQNNRIGIRNSFTIYDQTYEPIVSSSISYKRKTQAGSIIPKINYTNRLNKHGLQYDFAFYPKFSKRFYGFLNYGYSDASIYPNHKFAADLYANLPKSIELSAGMRYLDYRSRKVTVITNSLGHYRGNYYFSLRSYITPQPNRLTRVSGNLLIRKYLRDGDNYLGATIGMGYSPQLRQLTDGDELLAETLLYIESQRLGLAYQFTRKKNKQNIYRTNLGIARRELTFDTGNFFWAVSAGLTVQVRF